jgi:MFS family permease
MGAYLLSELFRNINSTIGPLLQQEFALDAATLDLMTSLFLFAVAGSQIFTGILLDRLGARRTVAMLLIIASIGGPAVCRRNFYNFACGTIADWYWHVRTAGQPRSR